MSGCKANFRDHPRTLYGANVSTVSALRQMMRTKRRGPRTGADRRPRFHETAAGQDYHPTKGWRRHG